MSEGARRHAVAVLGMLLATLPFSLSSLVLPWGRDQGIYAQAGARLLDGMLPYRDTFVFKPPATVLVHAVALGLFGRDMLAIRRLDVLWTGLTACTLYAIAWVATQSPRAAALAGVIFAFATHRAGWWASAQTDGWSNLFVGLALVAVLVGRPSVAGGLVAGLAVAGVAWFKYPGAAVLPVVVAVPILRARRAGLAPAAAVLSGFGGGMLGGLGLMAATGMLEPFLAIQREVVAPYTGPGGPGLRLSFGVFLQRFGNTFAELGVLAGLGVLVGAAGLGRRRTLDDRAVAWLAALGWALAGLLAALAQGKYFEYQYMLWIGGGALLAAVALRPVVDAPGRWRTPGLALVAGLVALTLLGSPWAGRWATLGEVAVGQTSLARSMRTGGYRSGDFDLRDVMDVAAWLRENTPADRPVFVWAYEPGIVVLADRQQASRFPYTYPLGVPWAPIERYEAELVAALEADPPSVIVVGSDDAVKVVTGHDLDSAALLRERTRLWDFVLVRYTPAETVGRYTVWVEQP